MDYYCFPTRTGDVSVFFDLNQYQDQSERFFYWCTQEDVRLAQEKGKLLLFDLRTNTFIDMNGTLVDIKEKEIFPRCKIQEGHILLEALQKEGGKSIENNQTSKIVEYWFQQISPKRNLHQTTLQELNDNCNFYYQEYGNRLFVKTVKKGFSKVCHIFDMNGNKSIYYNPWHNSFYHITEAITDPNLDLLVSQEVEILKDEYGKREWRVFVVKDKLWCISRCSDDPIPIEPYVIQNAKQRIEEFKQLSPAFPSSYCVDFFEYKGANGEIIFDICEFNPISSSGVYQNNDLVF